MFARAKPISSKAPVKIVKPASGGISGIGAGALGVGAIGIGGSAASIAGISSQAISAGAAIGGAVIAKEALNDVLTFASDNPLLIAGIGIVALLIILR